MVRWCAGAGAGWGSGSTSEEQELEQVEEQELEQGEALRALGSCAVLSLRMSIKAAHICQSAGHHREAVKKISYFELWTLYF